MGELSEKNLVVQTRLLDGVPLYKLNLQNPIVQKLIELNNALCWDAADIVV